MDDIDFQKRWGNLKRRYGAVYTWTCPECGTNLPADRAEQHTRRHRLIVHHTQLREMRAEVDPFSGPEWEDYG